SLIRSAIKLLLNQPQLAECIEDLQQISEVNIPYIELLTELLTLLKERLKERPNLSTGAILEHWRDRKETPALAKLAAQEIPISPSHLKSEFIGTIKRLYELGREQTIQELLQQIDSKNLATEDKIKLQKLISDAKIKVSKHEE
ncbi:MAG: hypothetical protein KAT71_00175, partial [Gammaproteobacteria bacterium]|nr:hypothetical protein [Gammaproteobacteria bacterium]